jgi:isochorismate synthase
MQGYFFYQNPKEDQIQGFECKVARLDSILDFKEGFLLATFDKSEVYALQPVQEVSLEVLDHLPGIENEVVSISFETYQDVIHEAISFCKEHQGKVVMSRVATADLPEDLKLSEFYHAICSAYDHSFNYCFHISEKGTWIGATPEVLVRKVNESCEVYSLAGSRSVDDPFEWTHKEIEEQAFVTSEIEKELQSLSIDYQISEVRTVRAGNVEHLLSELTFSTDRVMEVADQLHPTPAVCGLPKKAAREFIQSHEQHQRSFYAGIIGYVKKNEVALYVNLRCAEISDGKMSCYVGGGITKDSDVSKEWEETKIKSRTLLSVLKKN